jgi:hypothetical protein
MSPAYPGPRGEVRPIKVLRATSLEGSGIGTSGKIAGGTSEHTSNRLAGFPLFVFVT